MDFANLQIQYKKYQAEIDNKIKKVLKDSNYIMWMARQVKNFLKKY